MLMLMRRPFSGDGFLRLKVEKVRRFHLHIGALTVDLVRPIHYFVERLSRYRNQPRMGDPGTVVPVVGFALFIGANLGDCFLIRLGVVLDWDLSRHPAHGKRSAPVAGF